MIHFHSLKSILDEKKKLDLRFRPNDIYCKPACGVNRKTAGLLLRVRRRKRQPSHDLNRLTAQSGTHGDGETEASQNDGYEYKVDVLGTVTTAIKFEGIVWLTNYMYRWLHLFRELRLDWSLQIMRLDS